LSIYFIFSDENGAYKKDRSESFIRSHPYYTRIGLIIQADEWKKLNTLFINLKRKYKIPLDKEMKWSYLWSLRKYKQQRKTIPDDEPFKFFEKYDYHDLINFVDESLNLLNKLEYKKIVCTVADNKLMPKTNELAFYRMHLQNIMQRVEMELQSDSNNLGVLFIDPIGKRENDFLTNVYHGIFRSGDFIDTYKHIKDNLVVENSHQSVGIQMADFIAGSFCSFIKSRESDNYKRGVDMYSKYISPNLRRSKNNTLLGYGVVVVPKQVELKKKLDLFF